MMTILIIFLTAYISIGIFLFVGEALHWITIWSDPLCYIFWWYIIPFGRLGYTIYKKIKRRKKK